MRIATMPAFSDYLLVANAAMYPYSKLRPTRNSFFCKWVMLQGKVSTREGLCMEYFPVLANSIPNTVVIEPHYESQSQAVSTSAQQNNGHHEWYEAAVAMLDLALDEEYDRKELFRALISVQVKVEIHEYFVLTQW
jgi:hypothetical protein